MEIPSPCIDVCNLDDSEVCVGCGRHINEIAAWGGAAADIKLLIVAAARERLAQMQRQAQHKAQHKAGPA